MKCARCYEDVSFHTCSIFNSDEICMACEEDEKLAPGYERAREAESDAVRAGNLNFCIGLSPEAQVFLAERRRARKVNDSQRPKK